MKSLHHFFSEVVEIVALIKYKPDWQILVEKDVDRVFVQISATTLDSVSFKPVSWKGGKRYLSPFMCKQEIVSLVFDLIKSAELHEIHEFFRYRGASIYNPHLDPDVLASIASKTSSFCIRENAMTMRENKSL